MKKQLRFFSIHSIILISFIPLILLILLTYYGFYRIGSEQLKNQTYQSASNINAQISSSLGQSLANVSEAAAAVTSNRYFFQMKQNLEQDYSPVITPANYYRLSNLLDNLIRSNPNYFNSISLFIDDRSIFVHRTQAPDWIQGFSFQYEDYADTISTEHLTWVFPKDMHPYRLDTQTHSSLGLMMLLGSESSRLHGFILFEINDNLLLEEIQNAIITPGSQFAITRSSQLLLSQTSSMDFGTLSQNQFSEQFYGDGSCYFYKPVTSCATELELGILSQVPVEEISLNQQSLNQALLVIILFFLVFCALTYYGIHATVSRPLIRLNKCLTKSYDLTAPMEFHISGSREIQTITDTLNHFLDRIHTLIQNLNHEMDERRIAELNILYEQINPHFLYNALDTIYQLCDMEELDDAKEMTSSLASFYRIGVSKGASYISLEEECTHAQVYLSIMKIRFADFTYEIHLPEELKAFFTIKKILQPILENAIYHGIHPLYDRTGHISITVSEQGGDICIVITDNGIGVPENTLSAIERSLDQRFHPSEKGKLYGLKNVHARIRLTYQSPYGIQIQSEADQGTTVTITMPKITEIQKGASSHDETTVC